MPNFPTEILAQIKEHLLEEKSNIQKRIDDLSRQDPFSNPDRINDNAASDAEASEESSHDRFAAMVDELKSSLDDIESAIERISDSSYGYCTSCGQMIDTDRLNILPTATLCLKCEQNKNRKISGIK